jgi:hypothetical protein
MMKKLVKIILNEMKDDLIILKFFMYLSLKLIELKLN